MDKTHNFGTITLRQRLEDSLSMKSSLKKSYAERMTPIFLVSVWGHLLFNRPLKETLITCA